MALPGDNGSTALITCSALTLAAGANNSSIKSSSDNCSSTSLSKCQLVIPIMPLPVALSPISVLLHTLPRTKPNTTSRCCSGINNSANCATSEVAKSRELFCPAINLPQNASNKRSYTIKPGATIKNCRVNRSSVIPSALAAVLFNNCQIIKACNTHVLPVPVAIFRQYFGCAFLSAANWLSKLSVSNNSGATWLYKSLRLCDCNTSCATIAFNMACFWPT